MRRKRKLSWKEQVFMLFLFITAVVFVPTTVMLTVGMLPTMVASFVDRSRERMMGLTVGAMNLAGCTPFVLQLWTGSHTMAQTVDILSNPFTIVVMYFAAAVGYMIEWTLTGMVVIFMTEKAKLRLAEIDKIHEELERKWGIEVTGKVRIGEDGFPLEEQIPVKDKNEEDKAGNTEKNNNKEGEKKS
jgi:hypothetical protein